MKGKTKEDVPEIENAEFRKDRDRRKSMFLSMSIDSRVALPDELVITKQKIINSDTNKSLLGREIKAGDHLRGIDLNDLLDVSMGSDLSLDSNSSLVMKAGGGNSSEGKLPFFKWMKIQV